MASYKDTFEAKTFAANSFAAGAWRGTGVTVEVRVDAGAFRLDAFGSIARIDHYGSPARIDDNLGSPARIGQ